MPWQPSAAKAHNKKVKTKADQKLWSAVANKQLHAHGSDSRAIRIANAVINKKHGR